MNARPWFRAAKMLKRCSYALSLAAVLSLTNASFELQAQTLTVLHKFTSGADGELPYASLIRDAAGNLYGTTQYGGPSGFGTVFEVSPSGKEKVLHAFGGNPDGLFPYSPLVRDGAGNLYGTTSLGGTFGGGTVFKIDKSGAESILHSFNAPEGTLPLAGLVFSVDFKLYGTTSEGGLFGLGSIFTLDPISGDFTTLYSFDGTDGRTPAYGGLIEDSSGNFYGATASGGDATWGTIFVLDAGDNLRVLYTFKSGRDGENPTSQLVRDQSGALYGTSTGGDGLDFGTIFQLRPDGKKRILYRFSGGADGGYPNGGLIRDAAGNLYGTTIISGNSGTGTIFKLDPSGTETVLYNFSGGSDGAYPYGNVIRDRSGTLYGTTTGGGHGFGVVYKLTIP